MAKKKMSRAERKAEDERIVAEMEEAIKNLHAKRRNFRKRKFRKKGAGKKRRKSGESRTDDSAVGAPAGEIHCRRCKAVMKNGVCPECGYRMYVPLEDKTRKKSVLIVGVVCVAVFVVWLIVKSVKG